MKFNFATVAFLLSSVIAGSAMAEDSAPKLDLTKQTADSFQVQIDLIHKNMEAGGRFEYIHEDDREIVDNNLRTMYQLIKSNGTVAAMTDEDRISLFNHQERVNSLLSKNDSERIICEKAMQTGSLFKSATCHTVAELEKRRRESQDAIERTEYNQASYRGVAGSNASSIH